MTARARPLQVFLEKDDLERLEKWARARGWTKSQAIRAAVRALTREPAADPLLDLSGDVDGLPADVSENFNRYLDQTFRCRAARTVLPGTAPRPPDCSSIAARGSRCAVGAISTTSRRIGCSAKRSSGTSNS